MLVIREPVRKRFGSGVAYGLWLIPAARLFMPTVTRSVEHVVPAPTSFELEASQSLAMAHVAAAPTLIDAARRVADDLARRLARRRGCLFLSRIIAFERDRRAILKSSRQVIRLGSVRLVRSPEILSPVALEILRPIIALPHDFERTYKKRERRLVLEHETCPPSFRRSRRKSPALRSSLPPSLNPLAWVAHAASLRSGSGVRCPGAGQGAGLPIARATAVQSQRPLRGGRYSLRARSIVQPVFKGGFNPCFVVQVQADASPADCSSLPRPLRRCR